MGSRKFRRRAAGRVLLTGFHLCNTIANSVMVFNHLEWGDDLFTEGEKEYLAKVRSRINKDGEYLRSIGQKLCQSK